ncbi:glycoside hydrolase family 99-like domain-containing protein [Tahibacter harae]|uniref:Glycoside hydrolase family 99-like domain-containing protein n=1 Tax=Tahibacter harae TaxID=2963937 RepID=A0ABT1QXG3_9GAMM|nr:glycoside hydrolase family 99-like domain-containing protein [Tahibacter harae]MCQ4166979.1 glycoside hydrolase family 99-like domain-containing protein [Tahibacter harae]
MAMRLIYRYAPLSERAKLRHTYWLAYRFPALRNVVRTAERQVLVELNLAPDPHQPPAPAAPLSEPGVVPLAAAVAVECSAAAAAAPARRRIHSATRAVGYVPLRHAAPPAVQPACKLLAFYLPQFHPFPENDAWWGKGFTEWSNVGRAMPQVEGQYQPHLPGELGYYDLRVPAVQERQVELARLHGVGGFCFYFYWFAGKRLMEEPILQYLENPRCDLPFALCWANENWTRRWDGYDDDVLIAQDYSPADDIAFIEHVARYMRDPRYVRVDGRPLLLVYRPSLLPDPRATAQRWRERCRALGLGDIYICLTSAFDRLDPAAIGFDAMVEFPPNNSAPPQLTDKVYKFNPGFSGNVFDWRCFIERSRNYADPGHVFFRGVNPGWDNEARKPGVSNIFVHASPRGYEEWLVNAMRDTVKRFPREDQRLVFINAWNEWAEGAHLEPDVRLGYAWLDATRRAVEKVSQPAAAPAPAERKVCVIIHAYYPELLQEIFELLARWEVPHRVIITTVPEREAEVRSQLQAAGVEAECRVFENRGRDVLPFLRVANELADAGEELIVKLHTKRSLHRADGDIWRRDLLTKLIAVDNARRIHEAFRSTAQLGMVAPEGHILPMNFYWGSNQRNVHYLCRLMGVAHAEPSTDAFAAGSMFWIRVSALRPLLDVHIDEAEFEPELGQVDGTMAHAIERCFTLSVRAAGAYMASTQEPLASAMAQEAEYAYADSSRSPAV